MPAYECLTFRLLCDLPCEVNWRGQRWRIHIPLPQQSLFWAYAERVDGVFGLYCFHHAGTPEACARQLREVGAEFTAATVPARLCEQLVKEGRAEQLHVEAAERR